MSGIMPDIEWCRLHADCTLPNNHHGTCVSMRTAGGISSQTQKRLPRPVAEGGAVSAIADHSTEGISGPPAIDADAGGDAQPVDTAEPRQTPQGPPVEADGAARSSYRMGLQTHEHRLVRALAAARLSWTEDYRKVPAFIEAACAVADLVPILTCPGCGERFLQMDGRNTMWCSGRCRSRMGQRARRARLKSARPGPTDGPSQRGEGGE